MPSPFHLESLKLPCGVSPWSRKPASRSLLHFIQGHVEGESASGHLGRGLDSMSRDRAASSLRTRCLSTLLVCFFVFFSFFSFCFNCSIVDLQRCGNLCPTAKRLSFTPRDILFFIFFSILVYPRRLDIVPCAIQ